MGLISTIIGVVVSYLMMDLQGNKLEFISQSSIISGVVTALVVSVFVGKNAANKIILMQKNFLLNWCLGGFITVVCALLIGFFVHVNFVNNHFPANVLLFLFFVILIYAVVPILFFGSIIGYIVKVLGDK